MTEIVTNLSTRPMKCELNVLSKCDGSAMLSQGRTVALAALYGPLEVKHQKVQNDGVPVFVTYRSKSGRQGVYDRTYESVIQSACEALVFPKQFCRYEISIIVQEMQDSGSLLSAAINSACLAMISSGLEMSCLVGAVSVAIDRSDNYVIDPDNTVTQSAKMTLTVAFENVKKQIVASHLEGDCSMEDYNRALMICKKEVDNIFLYYKNIVQKYSVAL